MGSRQGGVECKGQKWAMARAVRCCGAKGRARVKGKGNRWVGGVGGCGSCAMHARMHAWGTWMGR